MASPPVEQRATDDRGTAGRITGARNSSKELPKARSTPRESARRLGAVYIELFRKGIIGKAPMGGWAMPAWLAPKRAGLLSGFGLTSKIDVALSAVYYGWLARDYPMVSQSYNRRAYEEDLRIFHPELAKLLPIVVDESLTEQVRVLRVIGRKFSSPGISERLHESALRIGSISGGTEPTAQDLQEIDSRRKSPLMGGASYREQFEFNQGRNPVTRTRVLKAIKAERDRLEAKLVAPLDPREYKAASIEKEISFLLSMLSVHPDTVKLLDLYARSPITGTERMDGEIQRAIDATVSLRNRLMNYDADDAWQYAPFVKAAVDRLKMLDVAGLPEFCVGMGRLLAQTKTDALMSTAAMVMVGLTIAFTGPVGAAVVGTLDLALTGMGVAVVRIRMYEQDIAATASNFSPEDLKLTEPADGDELALSIAGAFLSAVFLAGSVRGFKEYLKEQGLINAQKLDAQRFLNSASKKVEVLKVTTQNGTPYLPTEGVSRTPYLLTESGSATPYLLPEVEISSTNARGLGPPVRPTEAMPIPLQKPTLPPENAKPSLIEAPENARGGPLTDIQRKKAEWLLNRSVELKPGPTEILRWPGKSVNSSLAVKVIKRSPQGNPLIMEFIGVGRKGEVITIRNIAGKGNGLPVDMRFLNINDQLRNIRDDDLGRSLNAAGMGNWRKQSGHYWANAAGGAEETYNRLPMDKKWNEAKKGKNNRNTVERIFIDRIKLELGGTLSVDVSPIVDGTGALTGERCLVMDANGKVVKDFEPRVLPTFDPDDLLGGSIYTKRNEGNNSILSERYRLTDAEGNVIFDVEVNTRGKITDRVNVDKGKVGKVQAGNAGQFDAKGKPVKKKTSSQ